MKINPKWLDGEYIIQLASDGQGTRLYYRLTIADEGRQAFVGWHVAHVPTDFDMECSGMHEAIDQFEKRSK